jgi:hypothetical protein
LPLDSQQCGLAVMSLSILEQFSLRIGRIMERVKGMYNPDSGKQFSKHKRRPKSLGGTIETFLN